jgi:hypothetical protein
MTIVACSSDEETTTGTDGGGTGSDSSSGDSSTNRDSNTTTDSNTNTDTSTTTDAGDAGDSGKALACATYCTCMITTCPSKVDAGGCETTCLAQTTWDLTCRTTHCTYAKAGDTALHCGHAAGESTCN